MAQPIDFNPPPVNPREALCYKLQKAPEEHVEALLDIYTILQLLRDKGLLEITKGSLGSGEKILDLLSKIIDSEEAVGLFRNLVVLIKMVSALDPALLEKMHQALLTNLNDAKTKKPSGLFHLLGQLSSSDSRRLLGVVSGVVEAGGHYLGQNEPPDRKPDRKKEKVMRHSVT
jgi:uncharacterized protein YjgD (DUF1641 family)